MAYSKQTWDTTSYVNPTRMNHIEQGIYDASTATGTEYSSGVSVKDKIDEGIYSGVFDLGMPYSPITVTNGQAQVGNSITQTFPAGKYIAFGSVGASWSTDNGNARFLIDVDGTQYEGDNEARIKTNGECFYTASFSLATTGSHTIKLIAESPDTVKTVTVTDFQDLKMVILKVW